MKESIIINKKQDLIFGKVLKNSRSDFFKNVVKISVGTIAAQLLTIGFAPILSRVFSPESFGVYATFSSILSILVILATGRFELGIVVARSEKEALSLVKLAILLTTGFSVLLGFGAILLKGVGMEINFFSGLGNALYLIPLGVFFLGVLQIFNNWVNRHKDYSLIASSKVMQSTTTNFLALGLGYWVTIINGLVLSYVVAIGLTCYFIFRKRIQNIVSLIHRVTLTDLKEGLKKNRDFPLFSLPNAFLDTFSISIPVLFITSYFSEELTGQYSMALRLLTIPATLIGASISQVFFKTFSDALTMGEAKRILIRTWTVLAGLGLLPCLTVFFWGEEIFSFVLGPEWVVAGKIASLIALPILFSFVSSPTSTAFIVLRIQHLSFIFGLLGIILRPLAFYWGYWQKDLYLSLKAGAMVDILLIAIYNIIIFNKSGKNV